jgi:hypothetical protein
MDPSFTASLVKASEVVRSIGVRAAQNGPFLISLTTLSAGFALAPAPFVPTYVTAYRWAFTAVFVFLLAYMLLVRWFVYRPIRYKLWHLKRLGADEKAHLTHYIIEDRMTGYVSIMDATVSALASKGLLLYSSSLIPITDAPVVIDPHVYHYIRRHPDVIGLTADDVARKPAAPRIPQPWGQLLREDD